MSVPAGRLQFFALEATDYLERLEIIVGRATAPDAAELVRLTRALRGAALMAGLAPFATAAQAVEHLAKSYRDGLVPWDVAAVGSVTEAVTVLRRLVGRSHDWSPAETADAEALATRFGEPNVATERPGRGDEDLKPSVKDFVAREGAQIAGTLEHAAQAVELGQPDETAEVVLQRLQPLRGLAGLPRLSPLPEFLDGIELAIRSIRDGAPPPACSSALREAARAVATLSRQVADHGSAAADDPVVVAGARALIETFGDEDDVVPVATLFVAHDEAPIVEQGYFPEAAPSPDPQIELTSLADRLRQGADQLQAAGSVTARTLTLYGLTTHLAALGRQFHRERPVLGALLDATRAAIKTGAALHDPTGFGRHLQEAADELSVVASSRNAILFHDQLDGVITGLRNLPAPPVVPVESLAPEVDDESDVVAIESLAPDSVVAETGPSAFELSFSTYFRLVSEPAASIAKAPALVTETATVSETATVGVAATVQKGATVEEASTILPIEALTYRGRAALERADVVRRDLTVALKADRPFAEIEPLVSELIDLVPLALAE